MMKYVISLLVILSISVFAKTNSDLYNDFKGCLSDAKVDSCKKIMKEIYFTEHKIFRGIPTIDAILEKPSYTTFYLGFYNEYIAGCIDGNSFRGFHKNWGIKCDPQKIIDIYASLTDVLTMLTKADVRFTVNGCKKPTILNRGNNETVPEYAPSTGLIAINNPMGTAPGQTLIYGSTVIWDYVSYTIKSPFSLSYSTCKVRVSFKKKGKNIEEFKNKYPELYNLFFKYSDQMKRLLKKAKDFSMIRSNEKLIREVYSSGKLGSIISKPTELCYAKFYPYNSICVVDDVLYLTRHYESIDIIPSDCKIYVKNPNLKFDAPPKCKDFIENTEKAIEEADPGVVGDFICTNYIYIEEPYLQTTVKKIGINVEVSLTDQYLKFVNGLFLNCIPYTGVPFIASNTNTIGRDLYTNYRKYFIPLFIESLKKRK